ncbi:KTSC domain-containing protein [Methylomonas sp. LL1]|uniref:KTSC domain-containing protein n=1 Tax=Methylomonas sp. LL1 TaxID=2785785 RepID=UPI0018C3D995|nr:KTSC domain-containing protein [Methylomonas sp. LL1]QPK65138.1 KTSC domain-containing protein [Methylomonas sp. LL1]
MKMQSIKSSTIDVVGYDEKTHKMRVSFRHDPAREFCHVPEQTFQAFINARSKNRFYKRHIQDAYPC